MLGWLSTDKEQVGSSPSAAHFFTAPGEDGSGVCQYSMPSRPQRVRNVGTTVAEIKCTEVTISGIGLEEKWRSRGCVNV